MFKWLSLKNFSLLTFRWSTEESDILTALIKLLCFYSDKTVKRIGKFWLKSFILKILQNKKFLEPQSNADNIGTVI